MSKRSKGRHQQPKRRSQAPTLGNNAFPGQKSQGGAKRRALLIGAAVVVVAAVLYAVGGSGGRKSEIVALSSTNSGPSTPPAPVPSLLSATANVASGVGIAGPKIVFATPVYDFGQVKGGVVVKYTYVFTNAGSAMLQVSNVQASCGCTTAGEWSRQVEPGQTGSIPIQFNSGGFGGNVGKTITVTCNDPNQPVVTLQIKGNVWKPVELTPPYAIFNLTAETETNATAAVRIVNNEESPLTLSTPESSNPAFAAELRTNQPGKEFQLIVKTVPPLPAGSVQGQITLKTSSTNMPVLSVSAFANVQAVVTVMPSQITLPTGPLANALTTSLSIRNSGTNTLALSEAAVNAKGVDVQLKELQPGRYFTLTVSFPAGFEMVRGENVEVSVKSDHPQFPVIKVQVIQPPRPAPPVVPPGMPSVPPLPSQLPTEK